MKDIWFEVATFGGLLAAGAALMWRTGGVDLPEFEFTVTTWLLVALSLVALAALVVGAAVMTSRPLNRSTRKNG